MLVLFVSGCDTFRVIYFFESLELFDLLMGLLSIVGQNLGQTMERVLSIVYTIALLVLCKRLELSSSGFRGYDV